MPIKQSIEAFKLLFRTRLARADALPQLAVLGLMAGLLTTGVILLFRLAIEWPLAAILPDGDPENFEGLATWARAVLPLSGALLVAIAWYRLRISQRKVGVAHVMERLNFHQGYISFRSLVTQFLGGAMTVISGQSSGREGPAVHLGAACSSLLGQKFKLPNNSIRTLVACGTAAAISASFNTPIAGVIFAMEVVMMEYTITGFTPVIIASVIAALLTQAVYGAEPAFLVPALNMNSLLEVPYIVLCGLVIGGASASFVKLLRTSMQFQHVSIFYRILLAGLLTAFVAIFVPQIMGIGYDTVNAALFGTYGLGILCVIAISKLVVTSVSVGLGMPNGLVGPTLFIGATIGGAMGLIAQYFAPELASSPGFYAMLGMGAMMGSVLQAPLAALMALLELTHNPSIILPGMLVIVVSSMFASEVFKQKSVFLSILEAQGLSYQDNPTLQALRRVGVGAIMERKIVRSSDQINYLEAKDLLRQEARWLLVHKHDDMPCAIMPVVDLANYLSENEDALIDAENDPLKERKIINLLEIPAQRKELDSISIQATLQQVLDRMNEKKVDHLYVERPGTVGMIRIMGIVTRFDVENYYQYK